jgi:hypothetical protein
MAQVEGAVHVRVGEVPKPFGKFFIDLRRGEACSLLLSGGISFEDAIFFPLILVFLFQGLQVVPLASLPMELIISNRAGDAEGGRRAPGQVRWCLTYMRKKIKVLIVQLFYRSSESVTRGGKERV